jgi:hypothetical protein
MQAVWVPIAAAVAGAAVGAGAGALLAPKPAAMPKMASPAPTLLNAASAANDSTDEFRRRRGAAANVLTGPNGAEAPSPGAKALLGQ